jgi:formate hydrogenlyase subunit 3/multisubunit Na+/H+ antiporter MnhD subunit
MACFKRNYENLVPSLHVITSSIPGPLSVIINTVYSAKLHYLYCHLTIQEYSILFMTTISLQAFLVQLFSMSRTPHPYQTHLLT